MMEPDALDDTANRIRALGYDQETADNYAVAIGDCPEYDDNGQLIIRREGRIVDRLPPSILEPA
jgi:hypothetical protein